ncbi:DUF1501 domain-containing protein [Chitinimonas sp.]|uniref:DUF1501 domain-containing protein n=1 Tax=Chitinimonas sp. TaxID=1934313 RepID=UPI0035B18C17
MFDLLNNPLSRRRLLQWAGGSALGFSSRFAALGSLGAMGIASAQAAGTAADDYRALVCIYLSGGNDAFNLLVPTDAATYAAYASNRTRLAVPLGNLLPISPKHSDGHSYGLHGSARELQTLFNNGMLGFVANVGSLVAPISKADYDAGRNLPPQLFSHDDQSFQWMTGRPDSLEPAGWAGAMGELLQSSNAGNGLSLNLSVAGNNLLQTGPASAPYSVDPSGLSPIWPIGNDQPAGRIAAFKALVGQAQASGNLLEGASGGALAGTLNLSGLVGGALAQGKPLATVFPQTDLGQQLAMVAKLIGARSQLGAKRQIFFVNFYGFDTHDDQANAQPTLFQTLSQALFAFYQATQEMGVANNVTSFTASEFGRTLTSNDGGTDHGWGSHHLVMGGAVKGGDIYGTMPTIALNSPDDADRGAMIPTTSLYQYFATLGRWLGVADADLNSLFPGLSRFNANSLGILPAGQSSFTLQRSLAGSQISYRCVVTPMPADVGKTVNIYIGALAGGSLYVRNGTAWVPSTAAVIPAAATIVAGSAFTVDIASLSVGDNANLAGVQLYVGYGVNQADMLNGKIAYVGAVQ